MMILLLAIMYINGTNYMQSVLVNRDFLFTILFLKPFDFCSFTVLSYDLQ